MDDDKEQGLEGSPSMDGFSTEDRDRAHLEHTTVVDGAAKAHAPDISDAEVIAQATDRHLEAVVKPSLLPKPNSTDPDAPLGVRDDEEDN